MQDFVHLHNHSDYSLRDGACRIKDLVNAAVENKMKAVALTDHGVLSGVIEFIKEAKANNIKPIVGMEAYIVYKGDRFSRPKYVEDDDIDENAKRQKHYNHLILLAKNEQGFHNLIYLSSLGFLEGFYYKPRIDFDLLSKHKEGIICLSACAAGVVSYPLLKEGYDKAKEVAIKYKELFGDDFYIELQNHGMEFDETLLKGLPQIAKELGIKTVATNDVHYIKQEHAIPHNILLQISSTNKNGDYKTLRYGTDQLYFKSKEEMIELFKEFPEAIKNTLEITEKIEFVFKKKQNYMPEFKIPSDVNVSNLDDYLTKLTYDGLKRKIGDITEEIKKRVEYELSVIKKMGYSGYFLIVQDYIKKAKEMGILVSPGRGSAAGSLVSYALDITNVNPLKYDLLFERFLNPDRVSLPDIDTDFQDDRREEVFEYIIKKYGQESVAFIGTYNTLASRQSIKDVGRVLQIPISKVESITKKFPREFGKNYSIDRALKETPELKEYQNPKDEKIRELFEYARVLEDMNRNISQHAAGIVIAPGKIIDYVPLTKIKDTVVTQFDMKSIEEIGLVKMDILGLKTLTVIKKTIELVKETKGIEIVLDKIPLDDQKTYQLFAMGKTIGVFQFDKRHSQEFLKRLKPSSIIELSAMNALNRPGPMQYINEFIERKHGNKKITYIHPKLEPILKETYGIIVYQEQVMRIAHEVIGYTLAKADLMRRAMGKKDEKLLAAERSEFIESGVKKGLNRQIVEKIFEEIYRFKDYGFNKSHSVAYSIISYYTAYLKANYTLEFLVANLIANKDKINELTVFLNECRKFDIEILMPDVNSSDVDFTIENGKIRFGLAAIKNVGVNAVEKIIEERKKEPFKNIFDFASRIDQKIVTKRVFISLILAGAFDSLHDNRAQLIGSIEKIMKYGEYKKQTTQNGQISFFDDNETEAIPKLDEVEKWNRLETLKHEHKLLGFFLSGHPLYDYEIEVRSFTNFYFNDINTENGEDIIEIPNKIYSCVVILEVETKIYQQTKRMATLKVMDLTGTTECVMYDEAYKLYSKYLEEYKPVLLIGSGRISGDNVQINISQVIPIENAIETLGVGIILNFNSSELDEKLIENLKSCLRNFKGNLPVYLNLTYSNGHVEKFRLKKFPVKINNNLIAELKKYIKSDKITVIPKL